jgi:hypothetical protein
VFGLGAGSFCRSRIFFISNARELRDGFLLVLLRFIVDISNISANDFTVVLPPETENCLPSDFQFMTFPNSSSLSLDKTIFCEPDGPTHSWSV